MTSKLVPPSTLWAVDDQRKPAVSPELRSDPFDPQDGSVDPNEAQNGAAVPQATPIAASVGTQQRCLRCGTDEAAGAYCTWCRTAEYDLVEHRHEAKGGGCPLGPYRNPGPALVRGKVAVDAAAAFNRQNPPDLSSPYVTRRWTHNRKAAVA